MRDIVKLIHSLTHSLTHSPLERARTHAHSPSSSRDNQRSSLLGMVEHLGMRASTPARTHARNTPIGRGACGTCAALLACTRIMQIVYRPVTHFLHHRPHVSPCPCSIRDRGFAAPIGRGACGTCEALLDCTRFMQISPGHTLFAPWTSCFSVPVLCRPVCSRTSHLNTIIIINNKARQISKTKQRKTK